MSDTDQLTALVATVERTQRAEDVEGFLALFDPDAVWVTGGGRRLVGREAIAEFTRAVLPGGMNGGSVTYVVDHIAFIADDVAVTGVNQQYTDREGNPAGEGRPTYVWRRAGGTWRIVVGQNTTVA